jgi:hypothetical protein
MKKKPLKSIAVFLVMTVSFLSIAQPRAQAMLAPADTVQQSPQVDRKADLKTIQTTLESKIVRERLHALGLSDEEIQSRLTRLSDAQIHQLASQIRSINPAGEWVIGLLVVVVLVLLIIYLIKRV